MIKRPIVAIDGPAGAGKSTVTKRVARTLGYTQVDTGALYRSVAWLCQQRGIDFDRQDAVGVVAQELARPGMVKMWADEDVTRVSVGGEDVTEQVRSRDTALGASIVSQNPQVRSALLSIQRGLGEGGGVVLEGRDIGSVVFPQAEAKFYLTASAEVRARRRLSEIEGQGGNARLEEIIAEVEERDCRDTQRPISPLTRAEDAIEVDSSNMDIDAVVKFIVERVKRLETV